MLKELAKDNYRPLKNLRCIDDFVTILRADPTLIVKKYEDQKNFLISEELLEAILIMNPTFVRSMLLPVLETYQKDVARN